MSDQDGIELAALTPEHTGDGEDELVGLLTLDELTVEEAIIRLPVIGAGPGRAVPGTKVGGDGA